MNNKNSSELFTKGFVPSSVANLNILENFFIFEGKFLFWKENQILIWMKSSFWRRNN